MEVQTTDLIIKRLIQAIPESDHSLTHGKSGILIALSYYAAFDLNQNLKEEVNNAIQTCIDDILSDIETKHLDGSLAFGFSGISYALNTAFELGQKDKIDLDWFEDLNDLIIESLDYYIKIKEYDFLRGASGVLLYLLKFYPKEEYFFSYVESLYNQAIWKDENTCYWIFYSYNEEKKELEYRDDIINLGLAHGVSGIITLLSECYKKGFYKEKCLKMLNGAINYLRTVQNHENQSQFTGIVYEGVKYQNSSRLGWCYGDSSLGLSILKAGEYCENEEWIHYGNSICMKSTERNFDNAGLDEHGICHGYFGTMHIYNRLYDVTGNESYLEKKEYWYQTGMKNRNFDIDGLGFYQTELNNGHIEKFVTTGFLQGLSGIYLCLASYDTISYSWDNALLIAVDK